jgi:hypothetical protein
MPLHQQMKTAANIALPKCRRHNRSFQLLDFYRTLAMRRMEKSYGAAELEDHRLPALRQYVNVS